MIPNLGQEFAVSATAAAVAHLIHHPLYTLKSQMMFYGPQFHWKEFLSKALKQPTFLYRGVVPRTLGVMPEKAFKMQGWLVVSIFMERHYAEQTLSRSVLAGAAAGAATTIIGCPSERAMVLAHIRQQGFWSVIRQTGIKGLYLGWRSTLYRDVMFNSAFFTCRELTVTRWTKAHAGAIPSPWTRMILGIPAGFVASILACPFDVVKTRMQGKKLGISNKKCSQMILDIFRLEGIRYLFQGLLPRLVAVPSMMSCFYVINEELERQLLHSSHLNPA